MEEGVATSALKRCFGNKTVVVYGLGRTGESAIRLLLSAGANVWAYDDNAEMRDKIIDLFPSGVMVRCPKADEWKSVASLVFSPGIPLYHPTIHVVADEAKEYGCPVVCDVELLYHNYPDATFIGVTGTNGKSTVTNLIFQVLTSLGKNVAMGGNIGIAASQLSLKGEEKIFVVEMSSYQCDLIEDTTFDIGVLLNITPDHIDRHGSMAGYIVAKERLFRKQRNGHIAIIAMDDEYTQDVGKHLSMRDLNLVTVSGYGHTETDIRYNGEVVFLDNQENYILGNITSLPGKHNAQNVASVLGVLSALGISFDEEVKQAFHAYEPLPHRLQLVGQHGNVVFVNDSKATNAVATEQALQSYDNILWIVGGVAKEGGIDALTPYLNHVKCAFLIGKSCVEFSNKLQNIKENYVSNTIENAIEDIKLYCERHVEENFVVLLSPSCASFDQYPNFEARGDDFIICVEKVLKEWQRED